MTADRTTSLTPRGMSIVAADHPSLGDHIDRFLDELHDEPRFFGPRARTNPKPFPSLIAALRGRGGFRVAAVECGRVVGLARVDGAGELYLAVVADRRGAGIGAELVHAVLERAGELHFRRIVLRSSRRTPAVRRIGERLGCVVVDDVQGWTDLILTPGTVVPLRRSA